MLIVFVRPLSDQIVTTTGNGQQLYELRVFRNGSSGNLDIVSSYPAGVFSVFPTRTATSGEPYLVFQILTIPANSVRRIASDSTIYRYSYCKAIAP